MKAKDIQVGKLYQTRTGKTVKVSRIGVQWGVAYAEVWDKDGQDPHLVRVATLVCEVSAHVS